MRRLDEYLGKRDFDETPEPSSTLARPGLALRYSMQKHDATRLHWDLRLEWDGVLLSWAVTRGPSLDPEDKRLAVRTEDHPVSYLGFEGTIPKGNYGAGTVMSWDIGHWQPLIPVDKALAKGHLHFRLHGLRMTGGWHLVRMAGRRKGDTGRDNWLLMKEEDEAAHARDPVRRYLRSVSTGRTMASIGKDRPPEHPNRTGHQPSFRKPQLAKPNGHLSHDPKRWHELKFDGYRAMVSLGREGTRIYTRNGHDWTERFASLLPAFQQIDATSALIDGEIVAGAGLSGFGTLQTAIKKGGPFGYFAFDLLELSGDSLVSQPLTKRRAALEKLFRPLPKLGQVQLSPVIDGDPTEGFSAICAAGGEGVISKRRDAPYRGGRSSAWVKIKCTKRDDFIIAGWTRSSSRGRPFASLSLAEKDGSDLRYVGKVGTGFDADTMQTVARRLAGLSQPNAPVDVPNADAAGVEWVSPHLIAEVTYAERTGDGRLRHAVFEGLREDIMDVPQTDARDTNRVVVAGVAISSGDRLVYPKAKMTKLDVAEYYAAISDRMLPAVADRPLSLVRLPEGLGGPRFFQKHLGAGFPRGLKPIELVESDGDVAQYMRVTDAAGLVAAAQMGTLEFHIWGSTRGHLEKPDRLVFDLDPDEGLGFTTVRSAAMDLRDRLESLGLPSWPLLTGGKGVHVVVPLRRTATWETVKLFAQTFAVALSTRHPKRFTADMSKAKRKGRIFIDWLRNERGATAVAPFSLRARDTAPVATPVTWEELRLVKRADAFDARRILEDKDRRLPSLAPVSLSKAVVSALEQYVQG